MASPLGKSQQSNNNLPLIVAGTAVLAGALVVLVIALSGDSDEPEQRQKPAVQSKTIVASLPHSTDNNKPSSKPQEKQSPKLPPDEKTLPVLTPQIVDTTPPATVANNPPPTEPAAPLNPAPTVQANHDAGKKLTQVLDGVRSVWERHPGALNDSILADICTEVSKNFDTRSEARFKIIKAETPPGFQTATSWCYLSIDPINEAKGGWIYKDAVFLPLRKTEMAKFSPGDVLVMVGTMHNYSGDSGYIPDPHEEIELARLPVGGEKRLRFGFVSAIRAFDFKVVSADEKLDRLAWASQRKMEPEIASTQPSPSSVSPSSGFGSLPSEIYADLDAKLKASAMQHEDCERICRELTDKFKSRRLTLRFKINQVMPSESRMHAAWISVMSPPEGWQFMTTITIPQLSFHDKDVLVVSGNVRLSCFEFGSEIPGGTNNMVAKFGSDLVHHNFMLGLDSPSLRVEPK